MLRSERGRERVAAGPASEPTFPGLPCQVRGVWVAREASANVRERERNTEEKYTPFIFSQRIV